MLFSGIKACTLPGESLLRKYAESDAYTDCFHTIIDVSVTQTEYVNAFYTTAVFKLERAILKVAVAKPSDDSQAMQLAEGSIEQFAAWGVEDRRKNQLLMCDFQSRTRSWLMTRVQKNGTGTELFFGSAVVPVKNPATNELTLGRSYSLLLPFHRLYSKVLLHAVRSSLTRSAFKKQ